MIYLDSAATTQIAPEVLDAMTPYLKGEYGNPGSLYRHGTRAREAIYTARWQVAQLFDCYPDNVIFTSGGSEGNSMVFNGLRHQLMHEGRKHIVVSAIEHDSVLKAAKALEQDGFEITFVQPEENGCLSAEKVKSAICRDTGLVSMMYINNETGVQNPVDDVGNFCREYGVLFHTDCVQAADQIMVRGLGRVDFASISAHKIYGPKGIGALYVRDTRLLSPLIYGGAGQEHGLRGGTENVAGIVGFGKAAERIAVSGEYDIERISSLKLFFYNQLLTKFQELRLDTNRIHVNGMGVDTPGKVLNLRIDGVDGHSFAYMMDINGVCVSTGSACRSHEKEPSHVLKAMGLSDEEAFSSIRFSFSRYNTAQEAKEAAEAAAASVQALDRAVHL